MIYLRESPLTFWCLDNIKEITNLILYSNNLAKMILLGYWREAKNNCEFTLVSCCADLELNFKDYEMFRKKSYF